MDPIRNLRLSLSILTAVIVVGTLGYTLIEGWALFDSLYMTVITLATVGFKEVHELSAQGKAFTIGLIIFGVGVITYTAGSVIQFMVEGQLRQVVGRRKMEKQVAALKDHYIICGFGRIGQLICKEFRPARYHFWWSRRTRTCASAWPAKASCSCKATPPMTKPCRPPGSSGPAA